MEKIPKMDGVLRGNCCQTCRNIPLKTPMKKLTMKDSLIREAFSECLQQLLWLKEISDKAALRSQFVFSEDLILIYF